tara:strand:+ start:2405 stop:2707 length:303 start_codon:yes stop_codon:yes gene_type:complete
MQSGVVADNRKPSAKPYHKVTHHQPAPPYGRPPGARQTNSEPVHPAIETDEAFKFVFPTTENTKTTIRDSKPISDDRACLDIVEKSLTEPVMPLFLLLTF